MLFHKHSWTVIASHHSDIYWNDESQKEGELPSGIGTMILFQCQKCRKFKSVRLQGHWTTEELQQDEIRELEKLVGV